MLHQLRSEFIVNLVGVLKMKGREVLILNGTSGLTLDEYLRDAGSPAPQLLRRFGEDLIDALASLERHKVFHRDIKPSNIAVRQGAQRPQLVLFDFSWHRGLLKTSASERGPILTPSSPTVTRPCGSGCRAYAAAVTLHEIATGILPSWGGVDPTLVESDMKIATASFDPDLRRTRGFLSVQP